MKQQKLPIKETSSRISRNFGH